MARFCFISISVLALLLVLLTPTSPNPTDKNQSVNRHNPVVSNPDIIMKSFIERRDELINLYSAKGKSFDLYLNSISTLNTRESEREKFVWNAYPKIRFQEKVSKIENYDSTLKKYLQLMSNEIMYPKHGLFSSDASIKNPGIGFDGILHMDRLPNRPETVAKFKAAPQDMIYISNLRQIGNVIGMAILNKQFMDVTFEDDLYKVILGKKFPKFTIGVPWSLSEKEGDGFIKCVTYYPSLSTDPFLLTFYDKEGLHNGLVMIRKFTENNALFSIAALCQGIFDVIPQKAFEIFNEKEIQMLISGDTRAMQLSDWQHFSAIDFQDYDDQQSVHWFWEYIKGIEPQEHFQLLSFVTGTSRLPLGLLQRPDRLDHNDDMFVPVQSFNPFVLDQNDDDLVHVEKYGSNIPFVDLNWVVPPPASKPYINIVWSGQKDSVPYSDPYTNTLYLSTYSSYDIFKEFMDEIILVMPGITTWFAANHL